MPNSFTPFLQLCQWLPSDPVSHNDFNQDNQKIDSALQAEVNARSALASQVAAKASASALSSEITARTNAVSALNSQLALKGNCLIYYSSYVGNGESSLSLSFPNKPIIVFVMGDNIILRAIQGAPYAMCKTSGDGGAACPAKWSGNSLSWSNSVANVQYICNAKNVTHYVVALMDAAQ